MIWHPLWTSKCLISASSSQKAAFRFLRSLGFYSWLSMVTTRVICITKFPRPALKTLQRPLKFCWSFLSLMRFLTKYLDTAPLLSTYYEFVTINSCNSHRTSSIIASIQYTHYNIRFQYEIIISWAFWHLNSSNNLAFGRFLLVSTLMWVKCFLYAVGGFLQINTFNLFCCLYILY